MFECNQCPKVLKTRLNLKTHIAEVHGGQRLKCSFCEKTFQKQSDLNVHENAVHIVMNYQCELCKENFKSHKVASYHVRTFHKIKDEMSKGLINTIVPTKIKQGTCITFILKHRKVNFDCGYYLLSQTYFRKLDYGLHFSFQINN